MAPEQPEQPELSDEALEAVTQRLMVAMQYLIEEGCWPMQREFRDGLVAEGMSLPVANRLAMREEERRLGLEVEDDD